MTDERKVGSALEEVRWGIIGVGDVCEVKSGPAFQKCRRSRLVAVMRRTAAKAKDFAERHGVPAWYSTVEELLGDEQVNAVYVATPPGSHRDIALQCCAAGLPTYLEKPAARNSAETHEIVKAFEAAGVPLFVAYYRRGQEKFRHCRKLIRSGHLGDITSVTYRMLRPPFKLRDGDALPWRFQAHHSGGGLIMDVGCHTLDIIDYMVGPITHVQGTASSTSHTPYDVEDSVVLSGKIGNAVVSMSWSFAGPPATYDDTISIHGTRGTITMSTFGKEPVKLVTLKPPTDDAAATPTPAGKGDWITGSAGAEHLEATELAFTPPQHAHQPLVQLVVDELTGGAVCPSKGDNAVRCAAVMDAALDSFYGGRQRVAWDKPATWPGAMATHLTLYVGCYTGEGKGDGVRRVLFDTATGAFRDPDTGPDVAITDSPSWVAVNSAATVLYATLENEHADGYVEAFTIAADGTLASLGRQPTKGDSPAHLTLTPDGSHLLAANYFSSTILSFPIAPDGALMPSTWIHKHTAEDSEHELPGPDPAEQDIPHPHQVRFHNGILHVPDKGTDALIKYTFDNATGAATLLNRVHLPPGCGPRHIDWHPSLPVAYLVTELASTVIVLHADTGATLQTVSTLNADFSGKSYCSQILVHPTAKFLYAANRGANSIAAFAISPADGTLTPVARTTCGGNWPRSFTITPDGNYVIVANQLSHNITAFPIHPSTGALIPGRATTFDTPAASCIVALPSP